MKKNLVLSMTVACAMVACVKEPTFNRSEDPKPQPAPTEVAMTSNAKANCEDAKNGNVSIISVGPTLSLQQAAQQAFVCFAESNAEVQKAKAAALKKAAKKVKDTYGEQGECGKESAELQLLTLNSWKSDRATNVNENEAEGSSLATILVREPVVCTGIGTGLFGGIVTATSMYLEVNETTRFQLADEAAATQTITIKLKKITNL